MSKSIQIKKGLDIKLKGRPENKLSSVEVKHYALKPTDFNGVTPKMLVNVGDKVKAGTIVYFDKTRENLKFASPVSGTVTEVIRGEKRKMLEIRIEADGANESINFGKEDPNTMSREQIINRLLESGCWPMLIQRPYGVIANPQDEPKAIHVSAFDSAPLAVDLDFAMEGQGVAFQAGIDTLKKLTKGKVHLNIHKNETKSKVFLDAKGVEINQFSGPHPAGLVGIQIAHIDPINKGDIVWTIDPQSVVIIGRLFTDGVYNSEKVVALAGSEVKNPQYYKLKVGANISSLQNNIVDGAVRYISGNVLTGTQIEKGGYLSFYHQSLTVIPEGKYYSFLGWLVPSPKKHSFYRTALSWLTPNKEYRLDTNLNGGERAFVVTGAIEKVFPMDIYLIPLLKSVMINDIDKMEQLGIYEIIEEDIALCEYISTSKINMQNLLRQGLNSMYAEMS
ncbi:MAG: Na(+)-translocating NADH-quinone reductase subunit A [Bacteroidales bacterium]|nr:Na(+)-translocating NADH-quinone reductase subunit A [Bacteroidales bacterium]